MYREEREKDMTSQTPQSPAEKLIVSFYLGSSVAPEFYDDAKYGRCVTVMANERLVSLPMIELAKSIMEYKRARNKTTLYNSRSVNG